MTGLRVAYVLGTSAGGTGAHVAMLAAGCARRGAAVSVYGPAAAGRRFFPLAGAGQAAKADWAGTTGRAGGPGQAAGAGQVTFLPVQIADRPRPVRDAAAVLRLRYLLRRAAPAVVHAHGLRAGALAALAVAAVLPPADRPALLVTVHNAPPSGGVASLVYRLLERLTARRADAVVCVSADLAARMHRLGARETGRAVVAAPAASAPGPVEVAVARAGLGNVGRPVVLAVGRLTPQKGLGVLLAAAARWRERCPVPLVVIAGDGPLAAALRAQARAAGVDAVFLGQRSDIPALLAAADVVAVPSDWEGQPLIVQETLRAGRPLVATWAGGIPELTGEDGALLVPPRDPAALAAAVAAVLDDPGLAARLAGAARSRAAGLPTPGTAVTAALAIYARLAAGRGAGHGRHVMLHRTGERA